MADCPSLTGDFVRWIVPNGPGGGHDAYSRLLQPFLERRLGVRMVIENRPEAGGIVGVLAISKADPDGRTLGIINASGLLAANLMAESVGPNPVTDFTILGRIAVHRMIVLTGRKSGLADIDDLLRLAQTRQILVGVRDLGSTSFVAVPVTASLLGIEYALVTGYVGNAARTLAVIRGEVDVVIHNYDSARRYLEAGELIPLLQLSVSQDRGLVATLADVPFLSGPGGLARQRAVMNGRTPEQADREAGTLAEIMRAGRLIVAPRGIVNPLRLCLESALTEVINSEEFMVAAERAQLDIDFASGDAAHATVTNGAEELVHFDALVRAAVEQARR